MKPANQLTLDEVRVLVHTHQFLPAELEMVTSCLLEIERCVNFINERIAQAAIPPCDCFQCEEIAKKKLKPPRIPKVKEKVAPVDFSFD